MIAKNRNFSQQFDNYFHEQKRSDTAIWQKRVFAYVIDIFLCFVAIILIAVFIIFLKSVLNNDIFQWVSVLITILASFVIAAYLFFKDGFQGQGIGKRIMKIHVIRLETNKAIGFWCSALRMLVLRLIGIVELILLLMQPNHRRLGDFIAKTIVVNKDKQNKYET